MMNRSRPAASVPQVIGRAATEAPRPDRVSRDSADSFPASDPPSWTPLRVGAPEDDPGTRGDAG